MTPRLEILTLVRECIESGQDDYICWALDDVARQHPQHAAVCDEISREISAGLSDYPGDSLAYFVFREMCRITGQSNPQPYANAWLLKTPLAVMMRLAWLDKLIEQEAE